MPIKQQLTKKKWRKKRHKLDASESKMVEMFVSDVCRESTVSMTDVLGSVSAKVYISQEPMNTILIIKGRLVEGVVFLTEGKAAMLAEDETSLGHLDPGQYCGDVESLFNIPAMCTIVSLTRVTLLFVPKEQLRRLTRKLTVSKEDWCIQQRRLVTTNDINFDHWKHGLMRNCFSQLACFDGWSEPSVHELTKLLPPFPVIIFPKGAIVIHEGDPGDKMYILVKGRLNLYASHGFLSTVQAIRFPFLLSEEVIMCGDRHKLTAVAEDPCLIAGIKKDLLEKLSTKDEVTAKAWHGNLQLWRRRRQMISTNITEDFQTFVHVELLYKWIRERVQFAGCPPKCVYMIARMGKPMVWTANDQQQLETSGDDHKFLLLLLTLSRTREEGQEKGQHTIEKIALYSHKGLPTPVGAESDTTILAVKFDMEEVDGILNDFPGAAVDLG